MDQTDDTRLAESAEADVAHEADRPPTPDEEQTADRWPSRSTSTRSATISASSVKSAPTSRAKGRSRWEFQMSTNPQSDPSPLLLSEVSDNLDEEGFVGQFRSQPGGMIECLTCHQATPAEEFHADEVTRLEGASDPDDMVIVVPITCPHCQAPGTLIASFGPASSMEDADVLKRLQRHPSEGSTDGSTPGVV